MATSIYFGNPKSAWRKVYPPKTLCNLLCGILRKVRVQNPNYLNFLDKQDPTFAAFFNTVDNLFKSLCASGVGSTSSRTEVRSTEEESLLWSLGILNTTAPKGLLRAVFYVWEMFLFAGRPRTQRSGTVPI